MSSLAASHVSPTSSEICARVEASLQDLCSPYKPSLFDVDRLNQLASTRRKIPQYEPLYQAGDRFEAIYVIRMGSFKMEVCSQNGRSQVIGFQMARDILGMDGIEKEHHLCNAIALEDSEVCVLPFAKVEELTYNAVALQRNLHKIFGREMARHYGLTFLLGTMRAEERLATFLVDLSQRFMARGYSSKEFELRMLREEIGSYLGLKTETVSRAFSKLQETGYIDCRQKHVRILNLDALTQISRQRICGF